MGRWGSFVMGIVIVAAAAAPAAQAQTRGGIDASGHVLMHGTPRFVLGVYDSGGGYSSDPAAWESQIFSASGARGLQGIPLNVYLNYHLGGMPIGPTTALLDVLHGHGLMYLQTGNCFDAGSWTRYGAGSFSIMDQTYVQQYAQHPAALGYYIMDECEDALIAETTQHHQQLKAWDPQGLTFGATLAAGYRDPSLWKNAMDIMGTDPYPLYGREPSAGYTHFIVADFTSKLATAAGASRPVWTVLQFFKFTSDSRMPTASELRAHAVMAIVEGAQGLFWWDIGVNGLRQLDAATVSTSMGYLRQLTTELAGLEPALVAPAADGSLVGNSTRFTDPVAGRISQLQHNIAVEWLYSRIQWYQAELAALQAGDTSKSGGLLAGAANVRTRTKVVNGVGYVFAYNYTNQSQPVTFTWQSAPTSVKESKTGQTYAISGASWNDVFGPYEARIYVVNGAGTDTPPPSGGPSVSFTNPASGATVSGTTTVTVAAGGGTGTGYSYQIKVDGTAVYSGSSPSFSWNTTTVANGAHTLNAIVTDSAGGVGTTSRTVTVSNEAPPPASFSVSFSYPAAGASVSGGQSVGLSTTAAWGQPKTVTLSVDGAVLTSQTITGTTLWYTWDTTTATPGPHTLTASVTMGGQTATATLPVNVAGGGGSGAASLTASPSAAPAGTSVTATWSGIAGPNNTDWIGLYTPGATDAAYLTWIYVSCSRTPGAAAAAGSCSFVIPSSVAPGTYELRLLARNGYTRLAKSNSLTVATGSGPTVDASPTTVAAGGSVTAAWSAIAGATTTDWIGLYAPGSANTAYLAWQYVSCSHTPGAAASAGSCAFTIPPTLPPGTYELRLLASDGYTRLATSQAITVGAPTGSSLSASPSTVAPGGSVSVTWSGISSPSSLDWVGLYVPGTANTAYIAWMYVSCMQAPTAAAATGSCAFRIPSGLTPGTYELRLLANNGYSTLATSNALTVR